jgi:hypothetical protein
LMLYDMGYHGALVEEFVHWFMEEDREQQRLGGSSELREIPTASTMSIEEN